MRLQLQSVDIRFGKVHALAGADLDIEPSTCIALVGPNGAGKSTLMGVLLGLVRPDQGTLALDGTTFDLARRSTPFSLRARVGYLPEAVAFAESLTGRQVLRFFGRARGVSRVGVDRALERVGLTAAARRSVRGYSRGMRQRLGLAIAILSEPQLLVLDEPTGGLDQQGLSVLWQVMAEWKDAGRSVLLSTHDLALIERRVDQVVVMTEGRVLASGSPDELRQQVDLPVRVQLDLDEARAATALADRLAVEIQSAKVERDDLRLHVHIPPSQLIPVIQLLNGEVEHVLRTRVEEPGLDAIYEALLAEESP